MPLMENGLLNPRRSERLIAQFWLMALGISGRLPLPTIARIRALECLAAEWEALDELDASCTD